MDNCIIESYPLRRTVLYMEVDFSAIRRVSGKEEQLGVSWMLGATNQSLSSLEAATLT